jgi:hypothetical protein
MDNAGAVIGPLLATMFLSIGFSLQDIFLWTIVPGIITVTLALCIKEPQREVVKQEYQFSWSLEGMPDQFKRYLVVAGIFTLGNSSDMFLLLRAIVVGGNLIDYNLIWNPIISIIRHLWP